MITILEKSNLGNKPLTAFRDHTWNSSNILPNTATATFWHVRTKMKKFTFIEFLKMKAYFTNLTELELRCLFDAPGVLNDRLFVELLIAKQQVESEKTLTERLNILQKLIGKTEWNKNLFFSIQGNATAIIYECRRATRPVRKYSGYVRNSSAVGSKRASTTVRPDPEIFEWTKSVEIDFLRYLTVGEFTSGTPGCDLFTLTSLKRRNG